MRTDLGDLTYKVGFTGTLKIPIFSAPTDIELSIKAYREADGMSEAH